ncbi:MAG: dihydrofolate reductase [Akkermansia sp.]
MIMEEFIRLKKAHGLTLTAVVAMTSSHIIGKDGGIPWHIPEDMKLFRRLTLDHPIVMGRKTFESFPQSKPLPRRQNIVMTRDKQWHAEGTETITSPKDLVNISLLNKDIRIIGGSQIFQLFMPSLDILWVSILHQDCAGDTSFPEFESQFPHKVLKESFPEFDLWEYTR